MKIKVRDILRDIRSSQLLLSEERLEEVLERMACKKYGDDWTWDANEDQGIEIYEERLRRGLVYIPTVKG